MLALPRGGTLRADYSLIAIYLSICAAESQYAGKIVALCKPKSRYGNGGTGCPVCPNRAGGSPCPGGELCREPQRGLPLRAAGAQEGRQPAVFHPLVNLPFSLKGLGADGRLRKHKDAAVGLHFRRSGPMCPPISLPIRSVGYRTATQTVCSPQARHDRAAQLVFQYGASFPPTAPIPNS